MQELTDSIKRPNLRIIGIKEGEEVQAKGMCNILNKMITENFPNLKIVPYRCKRPPEHQTDQIKTELPYDVSSLKQQLQKLKPNITMKGQAAPNYRKRKSNTVESNLTLGTHNQTFKQLRQLNDRNHHIPISTNT
jgi:hypothetical protein